RGRMRARLRRRPAADGARGRPHRRDRAARGSPVPDRSHGGHAQRRGAAVFRGGDLHRRDLCAPGGSWTRASQRDRRARGSARAGGRGGEGARGTSGRHFAITKKQTRQLALERIERDAWAGEIERIWASPETLARIRDYVARTLRKG